MAWVYAFWALGLIAIGTVALDVVALRRGAGGRLPAVSLGIKGLVLGAFVVWWAYFEFFATATTWEDLTSFAGLLVVSVPLLLAAVVLDVIAARRMLRAPR